MESQNEILQRLQAIFDNFLLENFTPPNKVYFEKLLKNLEEKENAFVLQSQMSIDWINKVVTLLEQDFNRLDPTIISFAFNFCSILTCNEWAVIGFRENRIMDRIVAVVQRDTEKYNASIKLSVIRLFSAVSRYSLGLGYLRSKEIWHFLIHCCNRDDTHYVIRAARELLYELLYIFSVKTHNEELVIEILTGLLKPLRDNVYGDYDDVTVCVDDTNITHELNTTLDLIAFICEKTLESEEKTNITILCKSHFQLELSLWKLTTMTTNSNFFQKIMKALSAYNFAKLIFEQWTSGQIEPDNFSKFGVAFYNLIKIIISRKEFLVFLKIVEYNHILWKKLAPRAPEYIMIESNRVRFENQLIMFQLLPVFFNPRPYTWEGAEIFDSYVVKMLEISSEQTWRLCYTYRDELFTPDGVATTSVSNLAYKAIHGILSMGNMLEREQGITVFQALIYGIKEFIMTASNDHNDESSKVIVNENGKSCWKNRYEKEDLLAQSPNVLHAAIVAMQSLIQRFKITWKESLETICLVNGMVFILNLPDLPPTMAVESLKLVQLAIEHFLAPNMALLVDNLNGSGLVSLGPLIVKRFHDPNWEVRDSTLELVTSIANISRLKFPAFQQFLHDHKICPIVYDMAKHDSEPYVRASAFKCLTQMVSINVLWDNTLNNSDLIEHLFTVLYMESEAIVRKEAVHTLIKIYELRRVPSELKNKLYSTLSHLAVVDLHWEVKANALQFWQVEICKQFTNQGMIDGTFPTVTFSKEHKKIVTLNEREINLRIAKVLNELSQRGCLGVILKCLNDDCDLEVTKVAVCLVYRLLELLKKYDYETILEDMESNSSSTSSWTPLTPLTQTIDCEGNPIEKCNSVDISQALNNSIEEPPTADPIAAEMINSDAVIESILTERDYNYLMLAMQKQLHINGEDEEVKDETNKKANTLPHIDPLFYQIYAKVSAKEFMATIKDIDLEQLLQNNQKWLLCGESFLSLLDDIMHAIKPIDAESPIFADCY